MKTPQHQRRLFRLVVLAVFSGFLAGTAGAQAPLPGRYRCYQPPGYTVMAWFDLAGEEISVNGDAAKPVRIDTGTGRMALPPEALPPYRHGFHFAPGTKHGDAERATIVLARRADARPGQRSWATLPRCYLTTH